MGAPNTPKKGKLTQNATVLFLFPTRAEESDEVSYMKEFTSVSEPTQIQLGLL